MYIKEKGVYIDSICLKDILYTQFHYWPSMEVYQRKVIWFLMIHLVIFMTLLKLYLILWETPKSISPFIMIFNIHIKFGTWFNKVCNALGLLMQYFYINIIIHEDFILYCTSVEDSKLSCNILRMFTTVLYFTMLVNNEHIQHVFKPLGQWQMVLN